MKTRSLSTVACCAVAVFCAAWFAYALAEEQAAVSPASIAKKAQEAFNIKSYNESVRQAQEYLRTAPTGPQAVEMQKLIALSQAGLQKWQEAYKSLTDLVQKHEALNKDATVLETLSLSAIRIHNVPQARLWTDRAVAQYAAEQNGAKQIELLFRLAEFLTHTRLAQDAEGKPIKNYQHQIVHTVVAVLDIYDRIEQVESAGVRDVVRMLAGKAEVVRNYGHMLENLPPDQWPANLKTKYNLQRPFELAIEWEREIVRRFPTNAEAAQALLRIGDTQANHIEDYRAAVQTYTEVMEKYARSKAAEEAKRRMDEITAPTLNVAVEGPVVPGDFPKYEWNARNVQEINFTAYSIDLFDAVRKVEEFHFDLDRYLTDKLKPTRTWLVRTGDKGDHEHVQSPEWQQAPLTQSGAYLVKATGTNPEGKEAMMTCLMLVSQAAAALKSANSKDLLFVGDAETGQPFGEAEVLIQRIAGTQEVGGKRKPIYVYTSATVPDSGLLVLEDDQPQQGDERKLVVVRRGADYALIQGDSFFRYWRTQLEGFRIYSYTERPVYRPEQTVNFKQLLREYKDGVYHTLANENVVVEIYDARGNKVHEEKLVSDELGAVSGGFTLGAKPVLGMYSTRMRLRDQTHHLESGGLFRVEEYKKPEFTVTVEPDKPSYKVGERIRAKIHGEYYFGGAVADAQATYVVHRNTYHHDPVRPLPFGWFYDGQVGGRRGGLIWPPYPPDRTDLVAQGTVKTDAAGDAWIEFESKPFEQTPDADLQFTIEVAMVDQSRREIKATASLKVTHQAFYIDVDPQKRLYHPQDNAQIEVRGENPNRQPVPFEGTAVISFVDQREQRDEHGKVVKEEKLTELRSEEVKADQGGKAKLQFVPEKEGLYQIKVTAPDPYGGEVKGTAYLWVAEGKGEFSHYAYRDLELVADKTTLTAGESLHLLVTSKYADSYVLLTVEADDLYYHQLLFIPENGVSLEIPVAKNWQPNVELHAMLLRDQKVFTEELELHVPPVEDFLTVTIRTPKEEFQPREQAEVEVTVTDHLGAPVSCGLSLGAVDSSIFYIQEETRGDIRKFYHGRVRPHFVRTETSYSFHQRFPSMELNFYSSRVLRRQAMAPEMSMAAAAPLAADTAVAKAADKPMAEPQVRSEFPDTVYWAASLRTGSDGKAKATVRFPDSLTTWRLTAIAADVKTRVGEVKHEVVTRKNVIARLQAPRFFVERDQVVLSAIAHNYLQEAKTVRVKMQVGPQLTLLAASFEGSLVGEQKGSEERYLDVDVPAGGEKRVDFLASVLTPGEVEITASALTDAESDAMRQTFEVLEYGSEKLLAESGVLFGSGGSAEDVAVTLNVPDQIRAGSQSLSVHVSPTIAGVMLQSLPYLLEYPYGCTEQTMSRFLPAVLTAHTLRELGVDLADLQKLPNPDEQIRRRLERLQDNPVYDSEKMQQIIAAGVERLADFQQSDGGWGWWKQDQSNPYITSYVVAGLALAKRAGMALPEQMLERGVRFLADKVVQTEPVTRYPWQRGENVSVRTYMLFAISEAEPRLLAEPNIRERLDEMFQRRDELNDYSRALLALTLHTARMSEQAELVLANIKDRANVDEQTESVSWGDYSGYFYWYQSGTESTSFSLRALLAIVPEDPMIPKVVNWLMRHRRGTRWFNTKDTANVCYALAEYLKATDELNPDMTVEVEVEGGAKKEFRFTRDNILTMDEELVLSGDALGTGAKKVTLRRKGKGNLYWGAYATFFTKEDKITAAGNEIYVTRKYERLEPKVVEKTRKVYNRETRDHVEEKYSALEYIPHPLQDGDSLSSGELVEVTLEIDARNNFEYLMFEDPKPAGCEAVDLQSGSRWGDGLGAHMELRDEMVSFFAAYLNQGKHSIRYRLRAEIPGVFHALPARAECMYTPRVKGNGDSTVVRVVDEAKQQP